MNDDCIIFKNYPQHPAFYDPNKNIIYITPIAKKYPLALQYMIEHEKKHMEIGKINSMKQILETLYIDWVDVFIMAKGIWNNDPTINEFNCYMEEYHIILFSKMAEFSFALQFGTRSKWDITTIRFNNLFNPSGRVGKWPALLVGTIAYRFRKKQFI